MKVQAAHTILVASILFCTCGFLVAQAPTTSGASNKPASDVSSAPSTSATAPSAVKANDSKYVIGNDDMLAINVWKEPEVSRSLPVRSDGKISLPLVGEVQATGRTPLQLEKDIANKLRNYITDPEVTVMVQQINSERYNILGQVAKPGSYSLALTTSVLDAIATAGGFRDFAKKKGIYILRRSATGGDTRIPFNYKDVIKGKSPEQDIRLQPNDTVVVP
jgi:polysaccharide biosynthesis/export protein